MVKRNYIILLDSEERKQVKIMKKSLISILSGLIGILIGVVGTKKMIQKKIREGWEMSEKHLSLFLMMNQWVEIKQEGKNLRSYFEENGYYEIAIYGMSYAGETLINELQGSNVKIKYGIDQSAENIYADINLVSPDDELENVDAIIITPIKFFDEIEKKLSKKVNCPILSLEDILYEV